MPEVSLRVGIRGPTNNLSHTDLFEHFTRHKNRIIHINYQQSHAYVDVNEADAPDIIKRFDRTVLKGCTLTVDYSKRSREVQLPATSSKNHRSEEISDEAFRVFEQKVVDGLKTYLINTPGELANFLCVEKNEGLSDLLFTKSSYETILLIFSNDLFCVREGDLVRQGLVAAKDASKSSHLLFKCFQTSAFEVENISKCPRQSENMLLRIVGAVLDRFGPDVCVARFESDYAAAATGISSLMGYDSVKDENLIAGLNSLIYRFEQLSGTRDATASKNEINVDTDEVEGQRVSFRGVPVQPSFVELAELPVPILRPIVYRQPQVDLDDHLDRVFHVAREDGIRDVRNAVRLIRSGSLGKHEPLKGFADYRFSHLGATEGGLCYVFFSESLSQSLEKNKRTFDKRLIRGSLVVLSTDGFVTGSTGVVSKDVENGYVSINVESVIDCKTELLPLGILTNVSATYTILESEAYWESYRHSLRALQTMRMSDSPVMERVLCCPQVQVISKEASDGDILQDLDIFLDTAQNEAYKNIMTSDAPIVQGPPGTGKSFVGVSAVRALLHKTGFTGDPIVVVCYTNHALDDFLSSLISHEKVNFFDEEGEIKEGMLARIGARSKNAIVKKFVVGGPAEKMAQEERNNLCSAWNDAVVENFIPQFNEYIATYVKGLFEDAMAKELKRSQYMDEDEGKFYKIAGAQARDIDQFLDAVSGLKNIQSTLSMRPPQIRRLLTLEKAKMFSEERIEKLLPAARWCHATWKDFDDSRYAYEKAKKGVGTYFVDWRDSKGIEKAKVTQPNPDASYFNARVESVAEGGLFTSTFQSESEENDQAEKAFARNNFDSYLVAEPAFISKCTSQLSTNRILDSLSGPERLTFYHYCRTIHFESHRDTLTKSLRKAQWNVYSTNWNMKDRLQNAQVIGATTTGLSRLIKVFRQLRVQCVILEEAAEIPEHHALTAILPEAEKFIQIGDHQQLRPKLQVHGLQAYNLGISMMERMLSCNNSCTTLATQRRMRPEICNFIRPFYSKKVQLNDDAKVYQYPECPGEYGLDRSAGWVHWLHHDFPEAQGAQGSYQNRQEAEIAVALAWYFSKQQPEASITVLTPYRGQCNLADSIAWQRYKSLQAKPAEGEERKIRISTVDDFQGEESDVVILSLTRSERLGFLTEANRVCVALSRAKHLQIVLGNFKCFHQGVWEGMLTLAQKTTAGIKEHLSLYCERHNSERDLILKSFTIRDLISEGGGCHAQCRMLMACGHVCEAKCHGRVSCQQAYICQAPCERRERRCGHRCDKKCGEDCDRCEELVDVLCGCGGPVQVECYTLDRDGVTYFSNCTNKISIALKCGHTQSVPCATKNKPATKVPYIEPKCTQECGKLLGCGHACKGSCVSCAASNAHPVCDETCNRILPCGHVCIAHKCSACVCPPCMSVCDRVCFSSTLIGAPHTCSDPSHLIPSDTHAGSEVDLKLPCGHNLGAESIKDELNRVLRDPWSAIHSLNCSCSDCGVRYRPSLLNYSTISSAARNDWARLHYEIIRVSTNIQSARDMVQEYSDAGYRKFMEMCDHTEPFHIAELKWRVESLVKQHKEQCPMDPILRVHPTYWSARLIALGVLYELSQNAPRAAVSSARFPFMRLIQELYDMPDARAESLDTKLSQGSVLKWSKTNAKRVFEILTAGIKPILDKMLVPNEPMRDGIKKALGEEHPAYLEIISLLNLLARSGE